MQNTVLNAVLREKVGKSESKKMRRLKKVPANYYFHGEKNLPLAVDELEFFKIFTTKRGLINLKVGDTGSNLLCVIREVQLHPVTGSILHIDLVGVKKGEKMTTVVPVHLEGSAVAVREQGGRILHEIHELQVECLPKDLPDQIKIDITELTIGESVLVRDLEVPNVVIMLDGDAAIVLAKMGMLEEVEEEAPSEEVETEETDDKEEAAE